MQVCVECNRNQRRRLIAYVLFTAKAYFSKEDLGLAYIAVGKVQILTAISKTLIVCG